MAASEPSGSVAASGPWRLKPRLHLRKAPQTPRGFNFAISRGIVIPRERPSVLARAGITARDRGIYSPARVVRASTPTSPVRSAKADFAPFQRRIRSLWSGQAAAVHRARTPLPHSRTSARTHGSGAAR